MAVRLPGNRPKTVKIKGNFMGLATRLLASLQMMKRAQLVHEFTFVNSIIEILYFADFSLKSEVSLRLVELLRGIVIGPIVT